MKALVYLGPGRKQIEDRPKPELKEPASLRLPPNTALQRRQLAIFSGRCCNAR
jgi:hypothetical protein